MKRTSTFTVFLLALLLAGCNVFEGAQEEGTSNDPEILLLDAEAALQRNEPDLAVQYLERAEALEPENTALGLRIRAKLSTALLRSVDVDILTIHQLATPFTDLPTAYPGSVSAAKTTGLGCKFPATHPSTVFDPRSNPSADLAFNVLGEDLTDKALKRTGKLIRRIFSLSETDGFEFPCDEPSLDASIATLQESMTNSEISTLLVNYAVVLTTESFQNVVDVGGIADQNDIQFRYVFPPTDPVYISSCTPDVASCEDVTTSVQGDLDNLACSILLLDKRAEILEGTPQSLAQELADVAATAHDALVDGLGEDCYDHP